MVRVLSSWICVLFLFQVHISRADVACNVYFSQDVRTVEDFKGVIDFSLKNHAYYSEVDQKLLSHFVEQLPQYMDPYRIIFEESDIIRFESADPKMVRRIETDLVQNKIKRMEVLFARYQMRMDQLKNDFLDSNVYKNEILQLAESSEDLQMGSWGRSRSDVVLNAKNFIALQARAYLLYKQTPEDAYYMALKIFKKYLSQWEQKAGGANPLLEILSRSFVSGLDPYSEFKSRDELLEAVTEPTQKYILGVHMMEIRRGILVSRVISGTAAEAAGILKGDTILQIQGQDLGADIEMNNVIKKLNEISTPVVRLRILREGVEFDVQVARSTLKKDVKAPLKIMNTRMGKLISVRLNDFSEGTTLSFLASLNEAFKTGPVSGLILDLRGNPGGYVDEALQVLRVFLSSQPILIYQKKGEKRTVQLEGNHPTLDLPLIVLVDQGSASASELVSGVLQSEKRAIVVGSRTFGKGTAHSTLINDFGGIQITQDFFHFTNGSSPQIRGVQPDISIRIDRAPSRNAAGLDYALPEQTIDSVDRSLFADAIREGVFEKIKAVLEKRSLMRQKTGRLMTDSKEDVELLESFKILSEWVELMSALQIPKAS